MTHAPIIATDNSFKFHTDLIKSDHGQPRTSIHGKRQYKLIPLAEQKFTTAERIGRGFLGVIAVIFTLGIALLFKCINNLFTQETKKIYSTDANPKLKPNSTSSLVGSRVISISLLDNDTASLSTSISQANVTTQLDEHAISERELQSGIVITADIIAKIQSCMQNILQCNAEGGVSFYMSQNDHRIFSLDTAPQYIFKMCFTTNNLEGSSVQARYNKMINAKTVCRTHALGLLVIPNATLFTIESNDQEHEIIAEQKLDLTPDNSAQEHNYERYASSLDETIRQLAVFICKTGYSDVDWRNNPILNDAPDEHGYRKIGLIDLEEMKDAKTGLFGSGTRRGLVRCVTVKQGNIVKRVAIENALPIDSFAEVHADRKKEIAEGKALKDFYRERNIVTGMEPIQIAESDLDFPDFPGKAQQLKQLTFEVVAAINKKIGSADVSASLKGKRNITVNRYDDLFYKLHNKLIKPGENARETALTFRTEKEYYNATFMGQIMNKLIALRMLFTVKRFSHQYRIQA